MALTGMGMGTADATHAANLDPRGHEEDLGSPGSSSSFKMENDMKIIDNIKHIFTKEKAMKLEKTVDMMLADDPKERLKAEYHQVLYRRNKLQAFVKEMKTTDKKYYLYKWQLRVMDDYIYVLKERAKIEGITLK